MKAIKSVALIGMALIFSGCSFTALGTGAGALIGGGAGGKRGALLGAGTGMLLGAAADYHTGGFRPPVHGGHFPPSSGGGWYGSCGSVRPEHRAACEEGAARAQADNFREREQRARDFGYNSARRGSNSGWYGF